MTSTYLDSIAYLKQPTGLTLTTYVGNNARLNTNAAGVTALSVPATTVALAQYDALYIFDGPNSEQLQVGAGGAIQGATSIPLQSATAFAHAAGTVYCTDGTAGSLGEQIFIASRWIEDDICHQALWQTAYTNEILTLPTMRAAIDNQYNIHFRPRHFPISTLTTITLQDRYQNTYPLTVSQATTDSDQQTVDIPLDAITSSQTSQAIYPWWQTINRSTTMWLVLAYTAGYATGALPAPITRACALLTSEMFSQLVNPVGSDEIQQGKRRVVFTLRGDQTGESLLVKQATKLLAPYVTQAF